MTESGEATNVTGPVEATNVTGPEGSRGPTAAVPLHARCALAAYPRWWRERYGPDQERFLEDLVKDRRPLRRAVTDLVVGALRVRLRPVGMPQTVIAWRDRTRASIAWGTVPAFAGLVLVSVISQHSFRDSIGGTSPRGPSLSTGGRVAADAMSGLQWASLAVLVLLLTGWALVGGFADRVPKGRARRRWWRLTLAPLAAAVVEIGLQLLRNVLMPVVKGTTTAVVHGRPIMTLTYVSGRHPLAASVVSIAWDAVAVAGLLSVFAVVLAARSADLRVSDLRGGVRLAQLMAIVMLLSALASIAWGIGVTHQPSLPPAVLNGSAVTIRGWTGIQTSISASWPLVSTGLVAIAIVSGWGALSARRSYQAARALALSAK
ncbi:MAG TPA: hypothetical protein VK217_11405 [Acidimicrobiales bacterium]|nr:hypothetical protein [Acidimicrobiales bacterium]